MRPVFSNFITLDTKYTSPRTSILLVLVLCLLLTNCTLPNESEDQYAPSSINISGIFTGARSVTDYIVLYTMDPLGERITLGESIFDSAGRFSIYVDYPENLEAFLVYNNVQRIELYLETGFDLNLNAEVSDLKGTSQFLGSGAVENNYLASLTSVEGGLSPNFPDGYFEASLKEFHKIWGAIEESNQAKLEALNGASSSFLNLEYGKIIAKRIRAFHFFENAYPHFHQDSELIYEGEEAIFWNQLDLQNPGLLKSVVYRSTLNALLSNQVTELYNQDPVKDYELSRKRALNDFLKSSVDPQIKEYVLANSISEQLDFVGITVAQPEYEQFLVDYPDSRYTGSLKSKFAIWLELASGNPAPEFIGMSLNGKIIKLSDFRGKVVYVDVWATWCKPCLVEIPHSKELQETFKNDEIAFLYVSIDDNEGAWTKFLKKDSVFTGIHLISENAWRSKIVNDYVINGIPRYMLIDRNGMITNADEQPPSSGEYLIDAIKRLL